jgi:hypothetical protein
VLVVMPAQSALRRSWSVGCPHEATSSLEEVEPSDYRFCLPREFVLCHRRLTAAEEEVAKQRPQEESLVRIQPEFLMRTK